MDIETMDPGVLRVVCHSRCEDDYIEVYSTTGMACMVFHNLVFNGFY